jgi:UDP-glucose 4-epimerase
MRWLVSGAAGYIGSHVCRDLLQAGNEVLALDNLSTSTGDRIANQCELIIGDIRDVSLVQEIFSRRQIEGIMHLAALKSPEDSMKNETLYMDNNFIGTKVLIDTAITNGVDLFIQSSSSSVYGDSLNSDLREEDKLTPISPYGVSKLEAEKYLASKIQSEDIRGASLRYFNVVSHASRNLADKSSFNLFPSIIRAIQNNQPPIIYGKEFSTPDGTCIRDYVHVRDVSNAHLQIAANLQTGKLPSYAYNVGTGRGYSVLEIVGKFLSVMSSDLLPIFELPRSGDPHKVVANVERITEEVGFKSLYDLESMVLGALS